MWSGCEAKTKACSWIFLDVLACAGVRSRLCLQCRMREINNDAASLGLVPMTFDPTTFRLNSPLGKRILAVARGGDYAHPGEEDAIRIALGKYAGTAGCRWLDAGCGRGGTADFIVRAGWAEVSGFDIDGASIDEARGRFPNVRFYTCSVEDAADRIPGRFDLIYSFNAFYAFPDQRGALSNLAELAKPGGSLVVFDYMDRGGFSSSALAGNPEASHWRAIDPQRMADWLKTSGWRLETVENLDREYEQWYLWLTGQFESRRAELLAVAPAEAVDYARSFFSEVLGAIRSGVLGGGIVRATRD
jgi:SAM-dependent methyltransferase